MQRCTARTSVRRGTINLRICLLLYYQLKRGRTHGPCVPTCIRAARPIHHFTHQYGQSGYVGTHGSCVRLARNNQLVNLFTRSLLTKTWADARAVRPYMHSNNPLYPSFYTSIWAMWVCRDARFVRPFCAEQSTCQFVYSSTVNYIAFPSQPFCTLIWVILPRNLSHFTTRDG